MTRVVDKRDVSLIIIPNGDYDAKFYTSKRGNLKDIANRKYEKEYLCRSSSESIEEDPITPEMVIVINPNENYGIAQPHVYFNGVEVAPAKVRFGMDESYCWGVKSQDFVLIDFSGVS